MGLASLNMSYEPGGPKKTANNPKVQHLTVSRSYQRRHAKSLTAKNPSVQHLTVLHSYKRRYVTYDLRIRLRHHPFVIRTKQTLNKSVIVCIEGTYTSTKYVDIKHNEDLIININTNIMTVLMGFNYELLILYTTSNLPILI